MISPNIKRYEALADPMLLRVQAYFAKQSKILERVPTLLYLPASGTNGVSPYLQHLALTLPTALLLSSMRGRPKSLLQLGHR
jgi:hypothetical protein